MTITENLSSNSLELVISGRLDTGTAPELEAIVKNELDGIETLEFDFSKLDYISSAGLRQIVAAYKKMKGALTLRHVSDEIMNVISMTGLDKRMKFE